MYKQFSIKKYLDELAAKSAVPGGGSAAALSAAMGAALISMVVNFTLGKPKFEKHSLELKKILNSSEKLRFQCLSLVDLDAVAYKSKNVRDAMGVPFMLCRLCFEGIKLCPPLLTKSNPNLISDVAVAAVLLESAFVSAYFNVEINLRLLPDDKFAVGVRKELDDKTKVIKRIRLQMEERVGKIIRG